MIGRIILFLGVKLLSVPNMSPLHLGTGLNLIDSVRTLLFVNLKLRMKNFNAKHQLLCILPHRTPGEEGILLISLPCPAATLTLEKGFTIEAFKRGKRRKESSVKQEVSLSDSN